MLCAVPVLSWVENDEVPAASDRVCETLPVGDIYFAASTLPDTVLGDVVFEMDVQTPTGDNQLLGVEFDGNYFYVTGGNGGWDPNRVYVIDTFGNIILALDQPALPDYWGWRDLAWDGAYVGPDGIDTLYGSCGTMVHKFGIRFADSALIHHGSFQGPAYPLNRALAYMEDSAWFFTSSGETLRYNYKFSKADLRIDSCLSGWFMYGAAYDGDVSDGECIWWHSQNATTTPFYCLIEQMEPFTMTFTGIVFSYTPTIITSGIAGGLCFYEGFRGMDVLFALVQGNPVDIIVGIFVRYHAPGVADAQGVQDLCASDVLLCTPNPTRGRTTISYETAAPTEASLGIYDRAGKLVRTIVDDSRISGLRKVYWDGNDSQGKYLPSGVYFVKRISPRCTSTDKLILLK
jgi:hypothetical protein